MRRRKRTVEVSELLNGLWQTSAFRSGIHLTAAERAELQKVGVEAMLERARPLIRARLAPAKPINDGRQTPWHGFPAFPAQHATATCCRACLAGHHGVPAGAPLTDEQIEHVLACVRFYWYLELRDERSCECRRCRRPVHPASPHPSTRRQSPPATPSLGLELDASECGMRDAVCGIGETKDEGHTPSGYPPAEQMTTKDDHGPRTTEHGLPAGAPAPQRRTPNAEGPTPVTTGYSDIDLRRWKEYCDIETGSLWLIPTRARDGGHRLDYHGNFVPQIATQTFLRFSRRGEVILDPFLGAGTSAIEACRLGRRCIGVELNPTLVERLGDRFSAEVAAGKVALLNGDSAAAETVERVRAQLGGWGVSGAQLLMLHPPYHDIIRFTDQPEDLCNAPSVEQFIERFMAIARVYRELLERRRFAVLVIGDKYERGQLVPLGFRCMQAMNDAGFRTRSIVVKNIEGNEVGKGRDNNLWRYRALRGGFYLFKHEYVMIFQNP